MRMQLGCQPGPASSRRRPGKVYFYRLCQGTRGSEGRGVIRRGTARLPQLFKGNAQGQQRLSPCTPRSQWPGVFRGSCAPRLGSCIPPWGGYHPPEPVPCTSCPPANVKAGVRKIKAWELGMGCPVPHPPSCTRGTCLRMVGEGLCPPPPTTASCLTLCERTSLERSKSQSHGCFPSREWLRDSAQEQHPQSRDAQLLHPQYFSYTFSPFPYWFHNTPALLFRSTLSSRL